LFESPARNSRAFVVLESVIFPSKRSYTIWKINWLGLSTFRSHFGDSLGAIPNRFYASQTLDMMSW
ncbi:TPA: hypothetical protein ACVU5O_003738, partial [Vibrio parahaemolyticus]